MSSALAGKKWLLKMSAIVLIVAAVFLLLSANTTNCAYIDRDGRIAISIPGLSDGNEFNEGIAAIKIERGWGYINKKGAWIIPPQFANARNFSEGLAAVQIGKARFAYIRPDASAAFEVKADAVGDFHEGIAMVANQGLCGYINKQGKFVIPQDYVFDGYHYSSDGAIPVKIKTKNPVEASWVLIDQLNHPIFKTNFFGASEVSDQVAGICVAVKNKETTTESDKSESAKHALSKQGSQVHDLRWGYIDKAGNYVIQPQFLAAEPFSDGMASVAIELSNTHPTHLIYTYTDKTGKQLPFKLKNAGRFSDGLAPVRTQGKEYFGYIDKTGAFKISPRFSRADRFAEGLAFTRRPAFSRWWWEAY
jgi:hypothetical protein